MRAGPLTASIDLCAGNDRVSTGRSWAPIGVPVALLILITLAFRTWNLDVAIENAFWSDGSGWRLRQEPWIQFFYKYGTWPALLAGGVGVLVWITSYFWNALRRFRCLAALIALTLVIGPGLIVNVAFKDHFGRPRPRQVLEFGGAKTFQPVGALDFSFNGKSFPSGHASMGFLWFAPSIYFWRSRRRLAWLFAALALSHGGGMGLGRIAQGAHWPSDIVWSAGLVYLSACGIYHGLRFLSLARALPSGQSGPAAHDGWNLSIVIPFFNEANNVSPVLEEVRAVLPAAEIIAVDDASTDGSWEKLSSAPGVRALRLSRHLGQSAAIYHGLHACTRDLCGLMDGDGQNDPRNFLLLLAELEKGSADVACGYRINRADNWHRKLSSRIANRIRKFLLDDQIRDTGCSQKIFPRSAVGLLVPFRGLHRYLPAFFKQGGLRVAEVPVEHRARRAGRSNYGMWSRAWAGIYDLIGVRWLMTRHFPATRIQCSEPVLTSRTNEPFAVEA